RLTAESSTAAGLGAVGIARKTADRSFAVFSSSTCEEEETGTVQSPRESPRSRAFATFAERPTGMQKYHDSGWAANTISGPRRSAVECFQRSPGALFRRPWELKACRVCS